MALLDRDDPSKVLKRWPEWVFGPQEPYEFNRDKGGIVFPTGLVTKGETLLVYYGAADGTVCLATADVNLLRSVRDDLTRTAATRG